MLSNVKFLTTSLQTCIMNLKKALKAVRQYTHVRWHGECSLDSRVLTNQNKLNY